MSTSPFLERSSQYSLLNYVFVSMCVYVSKVVSYIGGISDCMYKIITVVGRSNTEVKILLIAKGEECDHSTLQAPHLSKATS